jgi:peptidyl-prolyl cis-trans isomerase C
MKGTRHMKRRTMLTGSLIVAMLLAGAVSPVRGTAADGPEAVSEDAVVAAIGQTPYTLADFRSRLQRLDAPYRYAAERRLPEYVKEFIRRELLAREARRLGIASEPHVLAEIEDATQAILVRALFKREVIARAMPTAEEVSAYYREHEAEFRIPEQVEVDQLEVATEAEAEAIRAAVQAGRPFKAVADVVAPDRAVVATVSRGMREPEVERAIFALEAGDVSGPIRTPQGIVVFRFRARHPARLQPLDAATPVIQARLAAQNQERLWKRLQDRLWTEQGVVLREDLLKAAASRAGAPPPGE